MLNTRDSLAMWRKSQSEMFVTQSSLSGATAIFAGSNQCIWCHCMPFGVRPENRKTYILRDLFGSFRFSRPVSVAYSVATGILVWESTLKHYGVQYCDARFVSHPSGKNFDYALGWKLWFCWKTRCKVRTCNYRVAIYLYNVGAWNSCICTEDWNEVLVHDPRSYLNK